MLAELFQDKTAPFHMHISDSESERVSNENDICKYMNMNG